MSEYLKTGYTAFALTVGSLLLLIPVLRKLSFGQYVRDDGPESHLGKSGTPTMGGIVFVFAIPAAVFLTGKVSGDTLAAIFLIVAMGVLGFLDDFLKIRNRRSEGLTARKKMIGQIMAAFLFSVALWRLTGGRIWAPFIDRYYDLGLLYIPMATFIIAATANGVNFTDGIDGLCSGVTFLVAIAFLLLCRAWGLASLTSLACALAGGCLGFLLFNLHPAKVFMGDTGSLALGGAVASLALLTGTELLLPLLGIIYVAEVASVILQVGYFKLTHGKRLFRMSPIHHHFELCGWGEGLVDIVFWLATTLAASVFLGILL